MSWFTGTAPSIKQVPTKTGRQQGVINQALDALQQQGTPSNLAQNPLYQQGSQYLMNMYGQSPEAFERFKAPYMRQFNEQIAPGLAERYAGMGSGGNFGGNFSQALGNAGAGLSESLGSMMEQLKASLLPNLLGYAQAPMNEYQNALSNLTGQSLFQNVEVPGQPGFGSELLSGILSGAGQAFGGPLGGMAAGAIGNFGKSLFNKSSNQGTLPASLQQGYDKLKARIG